MMEGQEQAEDGNSSAVCQKLAVSELKRAGEKARREGCSDIHVWLQVSISFHVLIQCS